jgi:hypothetical protein
LSDGIGKGLFLVDRSGAAIRAAIAHRPVSRARPEPHRPFQPDFPEDRPSAVYCEEDLRRRARLEPGEPDSSNSYEL